MKRCLLIATVAWLAASLASAHALKCRAPDDRGPHGTPAVLAPTSAADPTPSPPGAITLAMLPDIQYYTLCELPLLASQTGWLAAESGRRNIRAALFMGDLTEHNQANEWHFVREQIGVAEWSVPMLLAAGNHDVGRGGNTHSRDTLLTRYFTEPPGLAKSSLAETREPNDIQNAYYRIELPRVTLGVLVLEWAPRASTVAWANEVLQRHARDRVIVVTHAYLYDDSTRYDWKARGMSQLWNPLYYRLANAEAKTDPEADGEMLWNDLVRLHGNVFLVLCGHVAGTGTGHLASRGDAGNLVHQVLGNFQQLDEGGLGYLRLFEIAPDGASMRMKTYSPALGLFATGDTQRGEFEIQPSLW